jgi:hypothetical protein
MMKADEFKELFDNAKLMRSKLWVGKLETELKWKH